MNNVHPLPAKSALEIWHGTTPAQMHALVKDLFLWMHERGVLSVAVTREPNSTKAIVTIDGHKL